MTGESIKTKLLATTLFVGLSGGIWAGAAVAQDADDPIVVEQADDDEDAAVQERVVVTGSRIKRDSFSSTSPLQVLTSEVAADSGLFDTASLITSQPVFQGVQVGTDISAGGFVTNNGPGTSTANLRALGADRTLVLVNGRRLAPAGLGGAPSNPNINFIPSSLIQSVETITDGASAVYGSDAIAGAVNIILRDEFDGLSVNATYDKPQESGGTQQRYGVTWGTVGDRGSFLVAAEYFRASAILGNQRDFTRSDEGFSCSLDIEGILTTAPDGTPNGDPLAGGPLRRTCSEAITNIVAAPGFGNSPLGLGPQTAPGFFATGDLDDFRFRASPFRGGNGLTPESQRFSVYSTGKTEVDLLGHTTNAFVEFGFSNNQVDRRVTFGGQIFPTVDANNPFNPFGVDATPIFNDPVFRGRSESELQQTRFFAGFEGDFDFFAGQTDFFNDWSYEISGGYSRSLSSLRAPAILEENLSLSLNTTVQNPDGSFSCGVDTVGERFGFLTVQDCVPVNLFAPSLFSADPNNPPAFATQAEADFVTGVRSASTVVEQTIFGGYVGGPLFENPFFGGEIQAIAGFEWREDSFNSATDTVTEDGLAAGFSEDPTSVGAVDLLEFYGEVVVPLVRDVPFVKELNFEGSVRYLDPEFTASDVVFSVKGNYRPFDWLNLRGTYGTSYRAPNARETFLSGVTAFIGGGTDPCVVPAAVLAGDPDLRDPQLLANCMAQGVDPLTLGNAGVPSITTQTSGNQNLLPEESTAWTAGFVIDQPFTDYFDASLSVSYYDIEVEDAPATLGAGAILNTCLTSPTFPAEPACNLFNRDPGTGFVDTVAISPLNLSLAGVSGVDVNINVSKRDIQAFNRSWNFSTDVVATYSGTIESQFDDDSPVINAVNDIGIPSWRLNFQTRLATGPWSIFYRFDFIDGTRDRNAGLSTENSIGADGDFSFGGAATPEDVSVFLDAAGNPLNFLNGNLVPAGTPGSGPLTSGFGVSTIGNYFNHTLSARYGGDGWSVRAGINNLTNVTPPQLDANALSGTRIGNVPAGVGFDITGRSFFLNVVKEF